MSKVMNGGCQCGRVRYQAEVASDEAYWCHCRMCKKATGGIAAAFVQLPASAVTWLSEPEWYASSPVARRPFCPACGSPLGFAWAEGGEFIDLTVGSFDQPDRFRPVAHAGSEALQESWLDTRALPRHGSATTESVVRHWRAAGLEVPE